MEPSENNEINAEEDNISDLRVVSDQLEEDDGLLSKLRFNVRRQDSTKMTKAEEVYLGKFGNTKGKYVKTPCLFQG